MASIGRIVRSAPDAFRCGCGRYRSVIGCRRGYSGTTASVCAAKMRAASGPAPESSCSEAVALGGGMPSAWIEKRSTAKGETRWRVKYRLGGRESSLMSGGTFATKELAKKRRDAI